MSAKATSILIAGLIALVTGACSLTRLVAPAPTPLFATATEHPLVATLTALAVQPTQVTPPPAASATVGAQPTQPAVIATSVPVTTGSSPTPPPTVIAIPLRTNTSVPPTAAPPTAIPPSTVTNINIVLIALNDNGASGPAVGCGDSAIFVRVQIPYTQAVLRASIEKLLSLHSKDYGESGLYNALYQSNLSLDTLALVDGKATIGLKGQLVSGGVCDDPRMIAQIEQTALQFSTVKSVVITVNGVEIHEALSGK